MEDNEEEESTEKRQELEDQLRQTLASSNLLDHIGANYRCDCYDDDNDQEMMKSVTGVDQYGMGIEGGLNSNSEDEENDDSDSLDRSDSLQQPQPPAPQHATREHFTISEEAKSNKLKNLKKKEQKKRKKDEKKRAKLAGELERVEGEKRKAVDEIVATKKGGSSEQKKTKRKGDKGKGSNA
ncbi:hypothetical protein JCM5353_000407 [Sporobolomyces roseus]